MTKSETERLAIVETQVASILAGQEDHGAKLDDLLALRNKGLGAFWLATSLAGIGAISIIAQVLSWFGVTFGGAAS
jgi:hypothetical protein